MQQGTGSFRKRFVKPGSVYEKAQERVKAAIQSGDQNSIKHMKRELAKASANFRRVEESTRDQSRSLQAIMWYWGQGKRENRGAGALLSTPSFRVEREWGQFCSMRFLRR